ncbi:alpha/beta hydrolase [Actinophytocola sp.]|uniref:alpha/beta hydrolase n=1 Tax=Actinophytocola sp. TaxID=1872138 RepID=UPI002D7FEA89|nr:alpha/beta fold hydrolase [Actinophytocola sp.]HET9139195.1 alpha/beta fold hydrolase [Actinophytocola sp.]HEU5110704.1 alpha/beta fold hydrolase [Micromonosporaceae bacterium]
MRSRGMFVVVASAVVVALGGCTAGPSQRPEIVVRDPDAVPQSQSVPPSDVPVPPLDEPRQSTLRWGTCRPTVLNRLPESRPAWLTVGCTQVSSTLDSPYAPGRGTVRLQLLRAGAGPIPIVVLNDVGGQPGTIFAARLAATLPESFFTRFSLVGVDRRGTGNSEAPDCVPAAVRSRIVGVDPTAVQVDSWFEPAKTAGQQCSIELEGRMPALDTWRTTADLEAVRRALALPRLNAIGHGEGSRVLTGYADRYPDKVGRMVLDGLPDTNEDLISATEGVAAGAEATWQAFAADCKARGCELGADPVSVLPALVAQLRADPISTEGADVGVGVAMRAVLVGLADRAGWPALAAAIDAARRGDGAGLANLLDPIVTGSENQAPTFDGELVVGCNDTKPRLTVAQVTKAAQEWNTRYPMFGALMAQRLSLCGVWPVASKPVTVSAAEGAPPIVVIGTASDPVTPFAGTERAARALAAATLVSWQGGGHGALGQSSCATEAALTFLTDAKVPRDGTACPP